LGLKLFIHIFYIKVRSRLYNYNFHLLTTISIQKPWPRSDHLLHFWGSKCKEISGDKFLRYETQKNGGFVYLLSLHYLYFGKIMPTYFCHSFNSATYILVVYIIVLECTVEVHEWRNVPYSSIVNALAGSVLRLPPNSVAVQLSRNLHTGFWNNCL